MNKKLGVAIGLLVVLVFPASVSAQVIERVSVDSAGVEGNGESWSPAYRRVVSADDRYVVFQSDATNLVPDDLNGWSDVFIRDRQLGTTARVSVDSGGGEADGPSVSPAISDDGRFVVFRSAATNLVPDDFNWEWDVFIRDLQAGVTTRVSVSTDGGDANGDSGGPTESADGRYVAFGSDASNLVVGPNNWRGDIFVRDMQLGETVLVSAAWDGSLTDENSWNASISGDGRHVAFVTSSTNIVPDDFNGLADIFVRDLDMGRDRAHQRGRARR